MKRILISIAAALLALSMLFLCGCGATETDKENEDGAKDSAAVVWTDKTQVSSEMYSYFLNAYFRSFVSTYKSRLSGMGINTEKSLNEQYIDEEQSQTWYSYITVQAYGELTELLAIYDEANEIGYEISEDGQSVIDATVSRYEKDAENYGKTIEELYAAMFGEGVTEDVVRKCLEIQTIASEYYKNVYETPEFSDEEVENYYNENKNSFIYFDAVTMIVPTDGDAEKLMACKDVESFISVSREIITQNNFGGDYETYKNQIENILENKTAKRNGYNESNEFVLWVFEDGRAPFDTWCKKDDSTGKTTVEMVLPSESDPSAVLYRDDNPVRNITYALIQDEEEAKAAYDAWVADGAEKDGLNPLIDENDGGQAININKGSFRGEMIDWLFDPANTEGSHGIFTVEGAGTYLIYLMANGEPSWAVDARKALESDAYQASLNALCEKHSADYDGNVIYTVPIMTFQMTSGSDADVVG